MKLDNKTALKELQQVPADQLTPLQRQWLDAARAARRAVWVSVVQLFAMLAAIVLVGAVIHWVAGH